MIDILRPDNLSEIVEMLAIGFAIGVGGGAAAFVLSLIVNTFYGVSNG